MIPFLIFISVMIIQRLLELVIARRNEKWMKEQGAREFGLKHYQFIVLMHSLFFVVFIFEKISFFRELLPFWQLCAAVFVCALRSRGNARGEQFLNTLPKWDF